jgi:hypothetical protein
MITRRQAMAQTCSALLALALPRWTLRHNTTAQNSVSAAPDGALELQIQSSILRIEFDRKMRSRVFALFGPDPKPLAPFSVTETLTGVRTWSDFALKASHREHVTDAFGAGERLSLTGTSGVLRKDVSVTIYSEFPSFAIFDVLTRVAPMRSGRIGWFRCVPGLRKIIFSA